MKKILSILILILALFVFALTSYAIEVSLALAKENGGGKRCKTGDIIAVKPVGWQWGTEEIKRFLIVEVDLGNDITTIEDAQKLTVPQFKTGELWYPSSDLPQPEIVGKRRYNISFTDLISKASALGIPIEVAKMYDTKTVYQPFTKKTIPFTNMIHDKVSSKKLDNTQLSVIERTGK